MQELKRGSPESVGIPSDAIMRLLDELEYGGFTEMHGLMIYREDAVCAEGWWAPYAPGLRHGCQSLSKTYTATAIGLLDFEGKLSLTEHIADLFKAKLPARVTPYLREMTVRDVLMMGCGMRKVPEPGPRWIEDFLATPVETQPGTEWFYNTTGTTLLAAIVRERTGLQMLDYLNVRLFPALGIRRENLRMFKMQDGTEVGGAGLFATTEDNLRLMKLYLDGGVCNGVRYLSEAFVSEATSPLLDTAPAHIQQPWIHDNLRGYGYQIWRGDALGSYRADGAMGQFSVVYPQQRMIVSVTETADLPADPSVTHGPQKTLNALNRILLPALSPQPLAPDVRAWKRLRDRLSHLSVEAPPFTLRTAGDGFVQDGMYVFETHTITLLPDMKEIFSGTRLSRGAEGFAMRFTSRECLLHWRENGMAMTLHAAMDGSYAHNRCEIGQWPLDELCLSGAWTQERVFTLTVRWIETCYTQRMTFAFDPDYRRCTVAARRLKGFFGPCTESEAQASLPTEEGD